MKKSADDKARIILENDKLFKIGETDSFEYYKIRGESDIYTVRFDKSYYSYSCTCKNLRFIDCSHIKAVKKYQNVYEETEAN